jgi:hypothetical protein
LHLGIWILKVHEKLQKANKFLLSHLALSKNFLEVVVRELIKGACNSLFSSKYIPEFFEERL